MAVKYGEFQMPEKIVRDQGAGETHARFIAEPFERGFGHTIGNSLRRMLLTSIEAPAIISLRIEDIPHEYMAVEGIIEDMTNIILNFKQARLRKLPGENESYAREGRMLTTSIDVTEEDLKKGNGQRSITLKDVVHDDYFEVVNPDLHLFTVTKPMKRQVDLRVAIGRGYVPSERHEIEDKMVNEIVIDSNFSPVDLVNYFVENTRVGQHTDFDRLIIEIHTDGRILPEEALSFVSQICRRHLDVFTHVADEELSFEEVEEEQDSDHDLMMQKLSQRINEIELSVRSTNCLSGADIDTIAELVIKPESEMLKFRNFGKKSLTEIKAKLTQMGLVLGMDLSRYGITRENVKEVVKAYLTEKEQV